MKKSNISIIAVILCFFMAGCMTMSFKANSYQILDKSQESYDLITDSIIELHEDNLISDRMYMKIEEKADIYAEAHNGAIDVIKAHEKGLVGSDDVAAKISAALNALSELTEIATPYILE